MRHRTSIVVTVGVLLVLALLSAYFVTAYRAAREQAVSVALSGPMPGPGLADSSWGVRLGEPSVGSLAIASAGIPQATSLTSVRFTFILSNSAGPQVPTLPVFVTVELTLHGWVVTGDGTTG